MLAGKLKFIIGGLLVLFAVVFLIATSTNSTAEYFMTVDELKNVGQVAAGKSIRLSGAVIGSTIQYDPDTLTLTFEVAHVPGETEEIEEAGGLAQVLHDAVVDPSRARLTVIYVGVKPDLLQNEAQAIMTGQLGQDGIFHADELLLKCPTKYEEAVPEQVGSINIFLIF